MQFYITFGQIHTHSINGKTLDKNCVAEIEAEDKEDARNKANEYFNGVYHNLTQEIPNMDYYPRGIIRI